MNDAQQNLIDVAVLMAQELQEYVDVSIDCAGSNSAELGTQELLNDWEKAYAACGFFEDDHFQLAKAAAQRIGLTDEEREELQAAFQFDDMCPWTYPAGDQGMPAPGQRVLLYYQGELGPVGPVLGTPIHKDGSHIMNGKPIYNPILCWHPMPMDPEFLSREVAA